MRNRLIALERKYRDGDLEVPRRKISIYDPRGSEALTKPGGMIGGDRMSPDNHDYAVAYEKHLTGKIDRPITLVEFGVLRGVGLAVWADLLPAGSRIIGCEIDLSHFEENRKRLLALGAFQKNDIEVYEYDQFLDNTAWLNKILQGDFVDVVVDDGAHFDDAITQTLSSIWPFLAKGFVYFIEDNKRIHKVLPRYLYGKSVLSYNKDFMSVITGIPSYKEWIEGLVGMPVDFLHPKTWNEKINWKKLFDRNPLLPVVADKYLVRDYVKKTLGSAALLKPLLAVADRPEDIPFAKLPADYVIKPNHLSGAFIFVRGGVVDKTKVMNTCRQWMEKKYALHSMEWCYRAIPPKIIIEPLLEHDLHSFKFHVFHGECAFIQVNGGDVRDKKTRTFTFFTPDWDRIEMTYDLYPPEKIKKPAELKQMLECARKLAAPLDYVRVDFCMAGGRLYFEEMTNYPTGGHAKLDPATLEMDWGNLWDLKERYWEKGAK